MNDIDTDVLIVGGSTGGVAAALGAASVGRKVILTEETDWIGGQLTQHPPDEHRWIESFGCTARYRRFRDLVRDYYRDHYPLTPQARSDRYLNPGKGTESNLCYEPRIAVKVLESMMSYDISRHTLQVRQLRKLVRANVDRDRILAVTFFNLRTGEEETITSKYVLDATDLGDLLAVAQVEYVTGAESQADTAEPHAVVGEARPNNVQGFTVCFGMGWDPGSDRVGDKPNEYSKWREYVPKLTPAWPGPRFSWCISDTVTLQPVTKTLFENEFTKTAASSEGNTNFRSSIGTMWPFRRVIYKGHYPDNSVPHEVTIVNWPHTDYVEGNIIDKPEEEKQRHLSQAKALALCFLYWMQTEAPRHDDGYGYRGLYLRPDIMGTDDGLSKSPYIRESRRLKAQFTITENHVAKATCRNGKAEQFPDTVGIGAATMWVHPTVEGDNFRGIETLPFQIPLRSLLPIRVENMIAACKNIGTTHLTNGCYRRHPVEWNIGEAAGLLASFCLERSCSPTQVAGTSRLLVDYQGVLIKSGVELEWPHV